MTDRALALPNEAKLAQANAAESSLPGPIKAALWLLSIDRDLAVRVLGQLSDEEVKTLRSAVRTLDHADPEQLDAIHGEFFRTVQDPPLYVKGGMAYLHNLANRAFGDQRARDLMSDEGQVTTLPPSLRRADVGAAAALLRQQHPQIVAAVMAVLDEARAGQLLDRLPPEMRSSVIRRLARLKRIPHMALKQAETVLAAGLPVMTDADMEIDGVRIAASILNRVSAEVVDEVLSLIKDQNDESGAKVRKTMFTFEDLGRLDARAMQTLLKEVSQDDLLLALKTASAELRESILSGLSKRAAQGLQEELENMRPVRLSEVEEAQDKVLSIAQKLGQEGKIPLGESDGGDFV